MKSPVAGLGMQEGVLAAEMALPDRGRAEQEPNRVVRAGFLLDCLRSAEAELDAECSVREELPRAGAQVGNINYASIPTRAVERKFCSFLQC